MGTVKQKVAVVGSGISGLGAAYILKDSADITLYEKNGYLGGHTRTLQVDVAGKSIPVDTGFIVFNERNYPLLTGLFNHLGAPVVRTDMSFGVSIGNGWLEYASNGLAGLLGSPSNLFSMRFWLMVRDILKFNKQAHAYLDADPGFSLGECLDEIGVGEWFRKYYLLPMGGSIWSCPVDQMLKFPAASFLRFFNNHGLLTIKDHPQWYSVLGGARQYVERIVSELGGALVVRPAAIEIERDASGKVLIRDKEGNCNVFDQVIIASHPDEALRMLVNPTPQEEKILSAFKYQPNEVILHTDVSVMPRRKSAWASWVYRSEERDDSADAISLSYWMNNLQQLDTDVPVIVTLNPSRQPDPDKVINRHQFDHPVFDEGAIRAQAEFMSIQGTDRIWYCGAYQRNGFHEDGLWSAVRVAREMGVDVPWK